LDVATAYFNVGAFQLLQAGLKRPASLRLLLGAELEEISTRWGCLIVSSRIQ
jgi:hypothetical protein